MALMAETMPCTMMKAGGVGRGTGGSAVAGVAGQETRDGAAGVVTASTNIGSVASTRPHASPVWWGMAGRLDGGVDTRTKRSAISASRMWVLVGSALLLPAAVLTDGHA